MPLPSSRMTKQPTRPERYFPGKALAEDASSSSEESDDDEEQQQQQQPAPRAPPPKASSFPAIKRAAQVTLQPKAQPAIDLEGFVTASESEGEDDAEEDEGSDDDDEDSEESSGEEESSSDEELRNPMLAPKFIPKHKRAQVQQPSIDYDAQAAEDERKRKEKADSLLQAQIERNAALKAAGKKDWDEEDIAPEDQVDDTDGLDPEAEHAAWKLRELKRVKRDREALIAKEKEREEIERRRNLTAEEREKEDREYLEAQAEEKDGRGKMAFMQKYFHKGAFFNADDEQDEEVRAALQRDLAGKRFEDEISDKSVLPEYMRIRDMTRLGRKGRTKYKDLKSEDTGRWGEFPAKKRENAGLDERFQPDDRRRDSDRERTGANAISVGERRPRDDDARGDRNEKRPRYD